jgi:transcriptional regulator with XRE-family HTH domain
MPRQKYLCKPLDTIFLRWYKKVRKGTNMSQDYSVKVTVKNGRILARMRALGIKTQAQLARVAGVSTAQINDVIALRRAPRKLNGDWASHIYRVAAALDCEPEDLFTETQKTLAIKQNSYEIYMGEEDVMQLAAQNTAVEYGIDIDKLIALEPNQRTQRIIKLRLQGATYEQCAEEEGYASTERMRQIEAKFIANAKKKLRHTDYFKK